MNRRHLLAALVLTLASFPVLAPRAGAAADDVAECRVTLAYSILFHRAPRERHLDWWVAEDESPERLVSRMWHTPEGQAGTWRSGSLPHMVEAIDATCGQRPDRLTPQGWIDLGHGVYGPPVLARIRWCESRDRYTAANPTSSTRGAYQFLSVSWQGYGHASRYGVSAAHYATPAQQDEAAVLTWQRSGTRPWAASKGCWS